MRPRSVPFAAQTYPLPAGNGGGSGRGDGILIVPNLIALVTADNPGVNGDLAFVDTVQAWWTFDPDSTLDTDGITVLPSVTGPGRWLRLEIPHPAWQAQNVWHINEDTGNDENDGKTSGTALRGYPELVRRVGFGWTIDNRTVDIFIDSLTLTDAFFSMNIAAEGYAIVHGASQPIPGGTGVLTGFQAENLTTEATLIKDTDRTTWPVGGVVTITGGPRAGTRMFIAEDLGGGTARTSVPLIVDVTVNASIGIQQVLQAGDPYAIVQDTVFTDSTYDIIGFAASSLNHSFLVIENANIQDFRPAIGHALQFVGCQSVFFAAPEIGTTNHLFKGVCIGLVNNGSFGGLFLNCFMATYGVWFFNQHPVLQDTQPIGKPGSQHFYEDYAALFGTVNPITVWNGMKVYVRHGFFGSCTGDAITVQAGSQLRWTATVFSMTGQTNDVTLGGKNAIPRIDPATNLPGGAPVTLSFANIQATYGSGGFGGSAVDLYSQAAFLQVPDSLF